MMIVHSFRMLDFPLILLDVMLPDGDGYSFCRQLRESGNRIPIIFLTALSEEVNIVQGLELGGDDYVTKPYRVKELLSRIAANIRRYEGNVPNTGGISFGSHTFYVQQFRLVRGQKTVECTVSELKILRELVGNEDIVVERSRL